MDIDISVGKESVTINIEDPHRFDLSQIMLKVIDFAKDKGIDIKELRVEQLIPRMIRGVAGCEAGCPSNAKSVVRDGFGNFRLSYVEGGILKAAYLPGNGNGAPLEIKVFPDF